MPTYSELLKEYRDALQKIRKLTDERMTKDISPFDTLEDIRLVCDELLNKGTRKKPEA